MDLNKEKYDIDDLIEIVKRLRAPDGCPWDKVQTHESVRKDFIEEVYEAAEAIDENDAEHLREELGDVLFQVVFHCQIESEAGHFNMSDITDEVSRKMIIRHPHVFGDIKADTTEQVLTNWDAIKMQTHSQTKVSEAMESVSKTLPSLMRAQKLVKKASRAGVGIDDTKQAFDSVRENLNELERTCESGKTELYEKALGGLLFSAAGLSELIGTDGEQALYYACEEYIRQFKKYENTAAEGGIDIQSSCTQVTD